MHKDAIPPPPCLTTLPVQCFIDDFPVIFLSDFRECDRCLPAYESMHLSGTRTCL